MKDTIKILVFIIVAGWGVAGCSSGERSAESGSGAPSKSSVARDGYTVDADGLVESITDDSFYARRKKLYLHGQGRSTYFLVNDGYISLCSDGECTRQYEFKNLHEEGLPAWLKMCRFSEFGRRLKNGNLALDGAMFINVCVDKKGHPAYIVEKMGSDGDMVPLSKDVIPEGIPSLAIHDLTSGVKRRYRFSVAEDSQEAPVNGQSGVPAAQGAPTRCETLLQNEEDLQRQCKSAVLRACQELSAVITSNRMEGCGLNGEGSPSSRQIVQSDEEEKSAPVHSVPFSPGEQENSAAAAAEVCHASEEATVDATARNMNPPKYPPAAFRAGIQGQVILVVDVSAEGGVTNVGVEKSARNRDLDRAAMEAARGWKFNPAKCTDGRRVAGRVRIPVDFSISSNDDSYEDAPIAEPARDDANRKSGASLTARSGTRSASVTGFGDIREAIAALRTHPDYAGISAADFGGIDEKRNLAQLDASTSIFLPPGSHDTVVIYYEGNSGRHELTVHRLEDGQWQDVSRQALASYERNSSRYRGTNYILDTSKPEVKVHRLYPNRRAMTFGGRSFWPEPD